LPFSSCLPIDESFATKKFEHCFVRCIRPSRAFGGGRKARLFHIYRFRAVLKAGAFYGPYRQIYSGVRELAHFRRVPHRIDAARFGLSQSQKTSLHRKMLFACQRRGQLPSLRPRFDEERKTNPKPLVPRGGDMSMQVRLNAFAAFLSFGFVIAVVLGVL
jgi:hypothetical protein